MSATPEVVANSIFWALDLNLNGGTVSYGGDAPDTVTVVRDGKVFRVTVTEES